MLLTRSGDVGAVFRSTINALTSFPLFFIWLTAAAAATAYSDANSEGRVMIKTRVVLHNAGDVIRTRMLVGEKVDLIKKAGAVNKGLMFCEGACFVLVTEDLE